MDFHFYFYAHHTPHWHSTHCQKKITDRRPPLYNHLFASQPTINKTDSHKKNTL